MKFTGLQTTQDQPASPASPASVIATHSHAAITPRTTMTSDTRRRVPLSPSYQPLAISTNRRIYIQNLVNILHLSILKRDWQRGYRVWAILVSLPYVQSWFAFPHLLTKYFVPKRNRYDVLKSITNHHGIGVFQFSITYHLKLTRIRSLTMLRELQRRQRRKKRI